MAFVIGLGFALFFLGVPLLLTWMACGLFGIRLFSLRVALYVVITALHWNLYQAPKPPAEVVGQYAQPKVP